MHELGPLTHQYTDMHMLARQSSGRRLIFFFFHQVTYELKHVMSRTCIRHVGASTQPHVPAHCVGFSYIHTIAY
jgi:hypothetical protein